MNFEHVLAKRTNKVIYKDGDKVYKVFNKSYSKSNILNEALNLARVEPLDINVPKILGVTMQNDKYIIITEYIEGKTLSDMIKENPHKLSEYIYVFIQLQLDIHSLKSTDMPDMKEKFKRKINNSDLSDAIKYELNIHLDGMPKHNKLCHGDFHPSNIIFTNEGVPYILDWAHVTCGNGSADVANTYLNFILDGENQIAEEYLNQYCEITCTTRKYIEKWVRIAAAIQYTRNIVSQRELLLSMVDVMEFF